MPLGCAEDRKIHRTSHSIGLWIDFPQAVSELPQSPSLTYRSSSIWPMTMESSTVWEGRTDLRRIWHALEGPGTAHPMPSAAGYTFSDIIWLSTLQRHFRGSPTKQVITVSPHLIQKKDSTFIWVPETLQLHSQEPRLICHTV